MKKNEKLGKNEKKINPELERASKGREIEYSVWFQDLIETLDKC